jgi:hypothetical protein
MGRKKNYQMADGAEKSVESNKDTKGLVNTPNILL